MANNRPRLKARVMTKDEMAACDVNVEQHLIPYYDVPDDLLPFGDEEETEQDDEVVHSSLVKLISGAVHGFRNGMGMDHV